MSFMTISGPSAVWQMNVLTFSSPIYGSISSAQTKKMQMHFPIKSTQPELQLSVIFRSEKEFEDFQKFVRSHQQHSSADASLVTLSWPEFNINNWTGVIKNFRCGGMRRNYAPRATFTVDLVDSMVSSRTSSASLGVDPSTIYGAGMPDGVLTPPSAAENQTLLGIFGQDLNGNLRVSPTPATPSPPGQGPLSTFSGTNPVFAGSVVGG